MLMLQILLEVQIGLKPVFLTYEPFHVFSSIFILSPPTAPVVPSPYGTLPLWHPPPLAPSPCGTRATPYCTLPHRYTRCTTLPSPPLHEKKLVTKEFLEDLLKDLLIDAYFICEYLRILTRSSLRYLLRYLLLENNYKL